MNAPAPNWPAYEPGFLGVASVPTLAEIAYEGNVGLDDFVKLVQPISKVTTRSLYTKLVCTSLTVLFYCKGWPLYYMGRISGLSTLRKTPTSAENYLREEDANVVDARVCVTDIQCLLFLGTPRHRNKFSRMSDVFLYDMMRSESLNPRFK